MGLNPKERNTLNTAIDLITKFFSQDGNQAVGPVYTKFNTLKKELIKLSDEIKQDKIQENYKKETKMKRLRFKKPFNGVGKALQLIPENYKVNDKTFQMTDGNENYEIRWEGSLNEGRAVILKAEDKNMISENMNHMKHLMGYKSQETLGTLKGSERLTENASFKDVLNKTKVLLENVNKTSNMLTESTKEFSGPSIKGLPVNGDNEENHSKTIKGLPVKGKKGDDTHAGPKSPNLPIKEEGDCEDNDRFDEIFEGLESIDEELSDKQSDNMDTDKDGDIDGEDLKNLRNKSADNSVNENFDDDEDAGEDYYNSFVGDDPGMFYSHFNTKKEVLTQVIKKLQDRRPGEYYQPHIMSGVVLSMLSNV